MSQTGQRRDGDDVVECLQGYRTPEVAFYIHDMLDSLEAIATRCDMTALAKLLNAAKAEARRNF